MSPAATWTGGSSDDCWDPDARSGLIEGAHCGVSARLIEPRARVRWDRHGNPTLGLCVPAPPRAGAADSLSGGASRSVEATAAQCVVTVRDLSDRYWKGVGFLPWAILCPRFCGQSPLCLQRSQNIEERRPRWHLYKIDPFTVCRLCEFPEQRLGQAWRVIPVRRGSHTGRDETPAAKPNGHRQRPSAGSTRSIGERCRPGAAAQALGRGRRQVKSCRSLIRAR